MDHFGNVTDCYQQKLMISEVIAMNSPAIFKKLRRSGAHTTYVNTKDGGGEEQQEGKEKRGRKPPITTETDVLREKRRKTDELREKRRKTDELREKRRKTDELREKRRKTDELRENEYTTKPPKQKKSIHKEKRKYPFVKWAFSEHLIPPKRMDIFRTFKINRHLRESINPDKI
ncbi:hypothetical protein X798_02287 [Onchocerca flexuosa]|uniref:Uncharacterized protein n=1 Tax=Onchocerca flexuosa TaxID=387005 RepID=A0A238C0S4_9BILA|nr:hypothetical protein X798_02287 [Onchocerca flexuosa]